MEIERREAKKVKCIDVGELHELPDSKHQQQKKGNNNRKEGEKLSGSVHIKKAQTNFVFFYY